MANELAAGDPASAYRKARVMTASPEKLVLMMYDELASAVEAAEKSLAAGDMSSAHARLLKAQSIVEELTLALDVSAGGEIAKNLESLYDFVGNALVKANINKDGLLLVEVGKVVSGLRQAWHDGVCVTSTSIG